MSEGAVEGGGTPAGATPQGGAGQPGQAPASGQPADWMGGVAPEIREWATAKGYKDVGAALTGARELERWKGVPADQIMRRPDWSKPESVAEFRKSLGVPGDVTGYENHEVKLPTGAELDVEAIAKVSHRLGLPQAMHAQLLDAAGDLLSDVFKAEQSRLEQANVQADEALRVKYGANYENLESKAKVAMEGLGIDEQMREILGIGLGSKAAATEWLADRAKHFTEHQPADRSSGAGNGQFGGMTIEQAQARVAEIKASEPLRKAILVDREPQAMAEWERLNQIIATGRTKP